MEWIFQTSLFEDITKCYNEVTLGKWHFCILVQLWKQFSVLDHQTILIELCMKEGEIIVSHSDGVEFSNNPF